MKKWIRCFCWFFWDRSLKRLCALFRRALFRGFRNARHMLNKNTAFPRHLRRRRCRPYYKRLPSGTQGERRLCAQWPHPYSRTFCPLSINRCSPSNFRFVLHNRQGFLACIKTIRQSSLCGEFRQRKFRISVHGKRWTALNHPDLKVPAANQIDVDENGKITGLF